MPTAVSRAAAWLDWLAVSVLVVVLLTHYVIRPFAERVIAGAGGVVAAIAAGAGQMGALAHDTGAAIVERSPAAQARLGDPIVCAPVEEVEWLAAGDPHAVEFKFAVRGPRAAGMARVCGTFGATAFEVSSAQLETLDDVVLLTAP